VNILYCADSGICPGLMMSVLSLKNNTDRELHVYIITAELAYAGKGYDAISPEFALKLERILKRKNGGSSVTLINVGERFLKELPRANMDTRFTPMCMLRLFADEVDSIPDRILYLDCDVICRRDFSEFYKTDLTGCHIAGVQDRYGRFLFSSPRNSFNYLNSGVLLMNMKKIREDGIFAKCRKLCREEKMFMPDQTALNRLAAKKKVPSMYNEQGKIKDDTVFKHFTTFFKFFPKFKAVTVKPWDVKRMHEVLGLYEFDGLISECRKEIKND